MVYTPENSPILKRRRFIQLAAASTAAIIAPQMVQEAKSASAQTYADNQTTWPIIPTDLWYPSKPGRTNNGGNIYKFGGPLDEYDRVNGTDVRGFVEHQKLQSRLTDSSGFCNATANVNVRLGYLEAAGIITPQQASEVRGDENKFGLLVAISAGDVCKRATWTEVQGPGREDEARNNDENLNLLSKEGRAFVAKMLYLPGDWYFVVGGIEGNQVSVSGFGFTAKMPINRIINSYVPIRFEEAKKMNLPATLLHESFVNRYSQQNIGFDEAKAAQLAGIPSY